VSPYAFSGLSFFHTIEYQMRHIDRLLSEVRRRGAAEFEVTEEANARFLGRMTAKLGKSLFYVGECATSRSYYFNPDGEATLLRPTSTLNAVHEASRFPLSDYSFR
ncbi:MAG: NAD(P)/FAD-dependent oxidoreductase, partial [Mycobacterium sp.]|nr:NAD(P)/FAD-dependent oxidoreductase [Mycobacterium sp.]